MDNNKEINIVDFRRKFFEASNKYHMLDYKYRHGNRIINIFDNPMDIVVHCTAMLIRTSSIGRVRFDESLRVSEDTKFVYELLLKEKQYYVINDALYLYRKRFEDNSALQTSTQKDYWYNDTLEKSHLYLIKLSLDMYGEVIQFVQYFIMYEFQWRIKSGIGEFLSNEDKQRYIDNVTTALNYIDVDIISSQKYINNAWKFLALQIKYGNELQELILINEENRVLVDGNDFFSLNKFLNHVTELEVSNDKLLVIGDIQFPCDLDLYYKINDVYNKVDTYEMKSKVSFGDNVVRKIGYRNYIDVSNINELEFYIKWNGEFYRVKNSFYHYSKLNNSRGHSYYENGYMLYWKNKRKTICVKKNPSKLYRTYRELKYIAILLKRHHKFKVAIKRLIAVIYGLLNRKEIWLFADREFMGRDNAEALYQYILKQPDIVNREMYFVVEKDCEDYHRLKKLGNVVAYHTLKYEILFLNSTFLISSHADGYVNNPFGRNRTYYIDLFKFKYIYLTHGILLHDSTHWLTRVNKNFALNVVTSPYEYESIINGYYFFEDWQLLKTGMPRLDNLINSDIKSERKLLFMPSWRSTLVGSAIPNTQKRRFNKSFKESEYYKFYKRLLSDERLLKSLERANVNIKFCIHPSFRAQLEDFRLLENKRVEIVIDADSQYEAISSMGLVTDYSSAACDFAYLKKPVVYANFDYDHIYDVHYYNKGYFDYDIHGFGPNGTTYNDILTAIINMVERDFVVEEKYKRRMENFFFYVDGHNCERVYNEILKYRKELFGI